MAFIVPGGSHIGFCANRPPEGELSLFAMVFEILYPYLTPCQITKTGHQMHDHPEFRLSYETTFGISGTVLHWFASYLEGREQSVKVDNVLSSPSPLQFGVPQGSVLGPVLFTMYSQPLSDLICRHECDYHKYADDTQLSKGASPINFSLLSVISRHSLKVLLTGCTATS